MNFGKAFSFVFDDPDWLKKIAIAGLVLLIPIIGEIVVLGWALNISKRVMNQDPIVLPDINFGDDLARGFMGFVIGFVYSLPITLISSFLGIMDGIVSANVDSNGILAVLTMVYSCFGLLSFIYGVLIALVIPAAYSLYLAEGTLGAAFNLSKIFGMLKVNIGAYILVFLGTLVAGLIVPFGFIACVIGVIFTAAYSQAVMGHFYGQAYLEYKKKQDILPA